MNRAGGRGLKPHRAVLVPAHLPMKEQLDAVDESRVVVAVDGGALDLGLLARPATGFITIKRPADSEPPDGCLNCPTGGPDGQCCDWHLPLFAAASGWLAAESLAPGPGLAVDAAALQAALGRVEARLRALPEYAGWGEEAAWK